MDHFFQFSQIDIFDPPPHPKATTKSVRNWRIFNKREFADELNATTWDDVNDPNADTNKSFTTFYNKVNRLLDEMSP